MLNEVSWSIFIFLYIFSAFDQYLARTILNENSMGNKPNSFVSPKLIVEISETYTQYIFGVIRSVFCAKRRTKKIEDQASMGFRGYVFLFPLDFDM